MKIKYFISAIVVSLVGSTIAFAAPTGDALLPPNAKPGECYARVFSPPQFETISERVVTQQASESIKIQPAKYEWTEERVLVQEPSFKLQVVPATYKTVEEKILVKPESRRIVETPAVYETVSERVLDKPAHTIWKKGRGPIEKLDNGTGEIMCLVEIPATYKTISRKVVKAPASTKDVVVPAEFKTVSRKVIDQPATTRKVEIPAKYNTVKVQKLVSKAREQRVAIPGKEGVVTRTRKISEGAMQWKPVLCETNIGPDVVKPIQTALKREGLYKGPIDGAIGSGTIGALKSYQRKHNLAQGGLTMETIKRLTQKQA